jgi:hypothetical protein
MMQRRDFLKQAVATAAIAGIAPQALADNGRSYESPTLSVQLVEETPGATTVRLTEHGEADQAVVEAFYWTTVRLNGVANEQHVMLHKEATIQLVSGSTVETDILMPLADIVFIRVKEMKLLNQSEFGKVPSEGNGPVTGY